MTATTPVLVRKTKSSRRRISQRFASREGRAPEVFKEISGVTEAPTDIVARNRLALKARDSKELMYYTTDDE